MFVDWFKNVSAMFVYVYEIYATEGTRKGHYVTIGSNQMSSALKLILRHIFLVAGGLGTSS